MYGWGLAGNNERTSVNEQATSNNFSIWFGLETSDYGTTFDWLQADDPSKKGSTTWCAFPEDTKYFNPSVKPFMINYRVENLAALLEELKKENVTIVDEMAEYDYGKFIHILDPEGNIIELWEPKDDAEEGGTEG